MDTIRSLSAQIRDLARPVYPEPHVRFSHGWLSGTPRVSLYDCRRRVTTHAGETREQALRSLLDSTLALVRDSR